ncbi:hypothetical protein CU098_010782 [Rhizopus stolonifer]|uniref:Uncharacterized protein n=1 Tax=Rhizopus stolonifer TaxID=4846 RepID=A0A367KHQ1_RHIST|nr:hypothetical protein CU098_010782 [Rhizopus stolonifer]
MDDCDDPNFSPIIMIIKFPHLRYLSAKNRPENTNLEVDIKLLQEMLKFASVQPHSLPIQYVHVYHYQMDVEPHLQAYQKTWNKLSQHGHVQLDIRICDHMDALTHQPCQRIVCTTAQCWSCGYHFNHCWKCVSICDGCKIKRIPPLANDNQAKLKHQRKRIEQETDEFSVFA